MDGRLLSDVTSLGNRRPCRVSVLFTSTFHHLSAASRVWFCCCSSLRCRVPFPIVHVPGFGALSHCTGSLRSSITSLDQTVHMLNRGSAMITTSARWDLVQMHFFFHLLRPDSLVCGTNAMGRGI